MDFNRQNNRPAQRVAPTGRPTAQPTATTTTVEASPANTSYQPRSHKKNWFKHTFVMSVTALALLGGGYALSYVLPASAGGELSRVDSTKNQAVFLTNDQVYFGKITDITDTVIVMEDIYYLQGAPQQDPGSKQDAASPTQQPDMALAKLGNELHGPEDQMQINREQVLFWENLKADGKVSEAIKAYKP